MDRDFHFGATYAAALEAKIPQADALIIARAAQYVDNFSGGEYNSARSILGNRNKGIAQTVQSMTALATHAAVNYTGVDRWTAQIWPVFHFLPTVVAPANMPQAALSNADDEPLLPLICQPYSPLASALIVEARRIWAKLGGGPKYVAKRQDYLIRIGITMHVLADTFAHANFCGLPSEGINDVSNVQDNGNHVSMLPLRDYAPTATSEGYGFIGHGQIGHLPDEAWRCYTYTPAWTNSTIVRDNPVIYADAFFYMKLVMEYIFGNRADFPTSRADITTIGTERMLRETLFRDSPKSIDGQEEVWRVNNNPPGTGNAINYILPTIHQDQAFILAFARQAWKHQDLVLANCPQLRNILASKRVTV